MRPAHVLPALLLASGLAAPALAQSVSGFAFSQVDWYDADGVLHLANSSWGYLEIDVVPHPTDTWYFNLEGAAGGSPTWIVRNLPIFPESVLEAGRRGVDFDLVDLGIAEGVDVSSLTYTWSLTPVPQNVAPAGGSTLALVATLDRSAGGKDGGGLGAPGRPAGKNALGGATDVIVHQNVPEVQEGRKRCLAGASARSLSWLNTQYMLAHVPTGQGIYNSLVAVNVGSSGPGATTFEQDLAAIQTFWRGVDPTTVMNVLDIVGFVDLTTVPAVAGLQELAAPLPDLVDWIYQEFPQRAMELDYRIGNAGHIITLVGIYRQGGGVYILFREDEAQGPGVNGTNNLGDKAVVDAELRLVNGSWRFREDGQNFTVRAAVSHSGTNPIRVFCGGDGLDGNVLPCPCGNFGSAGHGCANSVNPMGALLGASGAPSADDVVLLASGMPSTTSCIFLQGSAQDSAFFGDGVRCAGGSLLRLRTRFASGGAAAFPDSTDTVTLSARGMVVPGSGMVRYYQTYYRNAAAAFCPPSTFNVTNGLVATW
jgi:hypothetical protein